MWFMQFGSPYSIPLYTKTASLSHEHMFYEHKKRQNYPTVILSLLESYSILQSHYTITDFL